MTAKPLSPHRSRSGTHRHRPPEGEAAVRPTVVLLHGLARTGRSLAGMRKFLESHGYPTWSCTWPSRQEVGAAAHEVAAWIARDLGDRPLVAVTHSLGGILVRHLPPEVRVQKVVMLAPPNRGSRVALELRGFGPFRWFYGPAGQQVGPAEGWPEPRWPLAVIAGTESLTLTNPISWMTRGLGLLPATEPSDGTVAVAETRLEGVHAFATVPASHTWIMDHPEARRLTLQFLESGRF